MSLRLNPSQPAPTRPIVFMAVAAVVLTIWQHQAWRQDRVSLPEFIAFHLATPLESRFTLIAGKAHDVGVAVARAPYLAEENRRLREQLKELEAARILTVETRLQNKQLRQKLGFEIDRPFVRIAAQVIGRSSSRTDRWVKIRAGGGKVLEVGNAVREAKGLVGRVVEANGDVGRVVLLVDRHHAVRGRDLRTRDEGMIYAADELETGPNRLRLEKARRGAAVQVADIIVTSGVGETYPAGVPIGVVESVRRSRASVNSLTAIVKPYVDFDHLDFVYVLRAGEQ